ncbi:MAG: hypothetical protein HZA62_02695 [Rhodocyclales bacterium]|nr:hypothetical protein [Rhodocyclales bacterium]
MAIDWLAVAKWLGPKGLKLAKETVAERDAVAIQNSRDELASAVATEIVRMILSGCTTANINLLNLVHEYHALIDRGGRVPRDLQTMVESLIEKAREAERSDNEYLLRHYSSGAMYRRVASKKAAKKTAAKRPAAKKAAAKQPPAKKSIKRPAAKKSIKRPAAKKATKRPAAKKSAKRPSAKKTAR